MNTIYFDNSATTMAYPEVVDIVTKTMKEKYANPSALHSAGIAAERLINSAREVVASTLNCKPGEVIFTSGGTEADNMAILGVANAYSRKGKHSAVGLFVIAAAWEIAFRSLRSSITLTHSEGCLTTRLEKQKREESSEESFLKVALRSGVIIICMITFIRCLFDLGIKSVTPTILNESYLELSPTLATALNIIVLVSGMVGTILSKLIYPKYMQNELKILVIFFGISLPLTVLVYLLLGKVNYLIIVALIAFIVMLMGGGTVFTTTYIAARYTKYGKGATIAGILNCVASLGVVTANTGFPAIAEQTGTWSATIAVWVALMAIALALIIVAIPVWSKFIRNRL